MDQGQNEAYRRAKERVGAIRAFYTVLVIYLVVNAGLLVIDMLTAGGPWFYWPLLGWGIGMVVFGLQVFVVGNRMGHDWEERKIREYMERDPS